MKLTLKERSQRYIAHRKALRGHTCLLITAVLFMTIPFANMLGNASGLSSETRSCDSIDNIIFSAVFTGDIMMGRSVQAVSRRTGYDAFFEHIAVYLTDFDLVLGNFEHPITESNEDYIVADKEILLSASEDCLPAIKRAGFNMLNLANNHMMDYGEKAMISTLDALDRAGIDYFGAGHDIGEASLYKLVECGDIKIAIVGANGALVPLSAATKQTGGVLPASGLESSICLSAVSAAAMAADIVIVYMHWGEEYTTALSSNQQEMSKRLIDAGATIVIGSHPHVLQPIEFYKNGVIFYSLGNFIMDQGWSRTKDSCLVCYYIDISGQGVFEVIPVRINNGSPEATENPIFVNRIFHTLTKNLALENFEIINNKLYIYPHATTFG